ncbi:MAG: tetratricopeptide repeat protein [Clostridia bacterium]|nr:tetratricopeptide repeat protein [Clostridia bacterium]
MNSGENRAFTDALDRFYSKEDLKGAGAFLENQYDICNHKGDEAGKLTVLNEMTGYYRQTGESEKGLKAVYEAIDSVEKLGLSSEVDGATILLNCATTMKTFGRAEQAVDYYEKAKKVLCGKLSPTHPLIAGLYNNMALTLQELGRKKEAEDLFLKAIDITLADNANALETAISYVNLAQLRFEEDMLDASVGLLMDKALDILKNPAYYGYAKYAFTCRKCAPAFGYMGYFAAEKYLGERADEVYERA